MMRGVADNARQVIGRRCTGGDGRSCDDQRAESREAGRWTRLVEEGLRPAEWLRWTAACGDRSCCSAVLIACRRGRRPSRHNCQPEDRSHDSRGEILGQIFDRGGGRRQLRSSASGSRPDDMRHAGEQARSRLLGSGATPATWDRDSLSDERVAMIGRGGRYPRSRRRRTRLDDVTRGGCGGEDDQ